MWQEAVRPYVEAGDMIALGVVQEQHPDRTLLYRQWRQLDWPIMVDSLNVLEHIQVVPVPVGIDASGIVRYARFRPSQLDEFMATEYEAVEVAADFNRAPEPDLDAMRAKAEASGDAADWRALGRATFNFTPPSHLNEAVTILEKAVEIDPDDGNNHFALGGALRRRYETPGLRLPTDAQTAVEHWGRALDLNPNHYIWRRRLQQYGPRLDKPYNFYFWVEQARADILARGEEPHPLTSEPMGSEVLASPGRGESADPEAPPANPDPEGRIARDEKKLAAIETIVTPARIQAGQRVRVRVNLRPDEALHPYWNNEADHLEIFAELPEGMTFGERQLTFPNPTEPETQELRQLEFEIVTAKTLAKGKHEFPAYALYYICEDEGGVCWYLRQDFTLSFEIDPTARTIK